MPPESGASLRCCDCNTPVERSCHTAFPILTFPCFEQHSVGHDVLELHVNAVRAYSSGSTPSSRSPPAASITVILCQAPSTATTSSHRPAKEEKLRSAFAQTRPVTVRAPPLLFLLLLLLLLLAPSLRPEAAVREEEIKQTSHSVTKARLRK